MVGISNISDAKNPHEKPSHISLDSHSSAKAEQKQQLAYEFVKTLPQKLAQLGINLDNIRW